MVTVFYVFDHGFMLNVASCMVLSVCIVVIYGPTQIFYVEGLSSYDYDLYNDIML